MIFFGQKAIHVYALIFWYEIEASNINACLEYKTGLKKCLVSSLTHFFPKKRSDFDFLARKNR